jgi:site-specific recombinase XerD
MFLERRCIVKTDFASLLHKYFCDYLVNDLGASGCTISTYRVAFVQFIDYMESVLHVAAENIDLHHITRQNILSFLDWLEQNRSVAVATRNQRLAAFKSFAFYVRYERPEYLVQTDDVRKIKIKKGQQKEISYLKPEGINLLLGQIDRATLSGQRDYAMFFLMYTTGIRVSELIQIKGRDVSMNHPRHLLIHGKGGKKRHVPMIKQLGKVLSDYTSKTGALLPHNLDRPLFINHSRNQFTRQGINHLLRKYAYMARTRNPSLIPADTSPHKLRHSTAMALVDKGTELIVVRDLLGHASVQTTEIYAKLSNHRKREAIEGASQQIVDPEEPLWEANASLKEWLMKLGKNRIM